MFDELGNIADKARAEFVKQRRDNPFLWLPLLRRKRAEKIAIELGADSGATCQLVSDHALGRKRVELRAPSILHL